MPLELPQTEVPYVADLLQHLPQIVPRQELRTMGQWIWQAMLWNNALVVIIIITAATQTAMATVTFHLRATPILQTGPQLAVEQEVELYVAEIGTIMAGNIALPATETG